MANFTKKQMFRFNFLLSLLLSLSFNLNFTSLVRAENANTAPQEVKELLTNFEQVANEGKLTEMLTFYSENFTNSDGLNYDSFQKGLQNLWSKYPGLRYSIDLNSWQEKDGKITTETTTYLRGYSRENGRLIFINSTINSREIWLDKKIVSQEIIREENMLTTGIKPPSIRVNAPEKGKIGEQFNFDIIVNEPLGDDVLLGGIISEETNPNLYLNPSSFELEVLPAGGIFKIVNPEKSGNQWLSAILVRSDGITSVTRRIQIED